MMTGQAGTFHWMAPETLENKAYTHKADVYSYGVIIISLNLSIDCSVGNNLQRTTIQELQPS